MICCVLFLRFSLVSDDDLLTQMMIFCPDYDLVSRMIIC